ncbi:site-specific integrase [Chryseobacterium binzhouense]|uniref:site-specific integrase n=1 Tax=Chryseobacterium binzhouense TaxID=2593646 RepID=UPI001E2C5FA8|nr:site-specific integrase [Chryseobacterium binzhouense]
MGNVSFVLKEPKSIKKTSIVLIFRYSNQTVKIYTKQSIEPIFWDKSKQRVRQSLKVNSAKINSLLNEMDSKIVKLYDKVLEDYERNPEPKEFKNLFELEYFQNKPQFSKRKVKLLMEVFDEYGQRMISENKPSSADKYRQAKQNLLDFSKDLSYNVQFETMTNEFRNHFIHYLRHNKKYAETTIHRKLKFIKTIVHYALDCGYISGVKVNLRKFGVADVIPDKIALTQNELKEIENLDLSQNLRLDKIRDRFLIGCYTGLRFSDFIRLNKNHIIDERYIQLKQEKTKDVNTQPFWSEVRKIFEKYDYELPKPISESNFNLYLKEICGLCDTLKKEQEITEYEGGKAKSVYKPRFELVTSHTARRTFVTLKAEQGLALEDIAIATGHKNIKTLQGYMKLDAKQKADRLALMSKKISEKNGK